MRFLISTILFASLYLTLLGPHVQAEEKTSWRTVEALQFDWNSDGKPDRVIFEIPTAYGAGEPQKFTRVRMEIAGQKEILFDELDGVAWIPAKDEPPRLVESKYALIARVSNMDKRPVLLFQNWDSSDPGKLFALAIDANNRPRKIFDSNFALARFQAVAKDQAMIGVPRFAEEVSGLCGYEPELVYVFQFKNDSLVLSLSEAESKKYNLKQGYPWRGPKHSDEIRVTCRSSL